jgi:hypothetical protein
MTSDWIAGAVVMVGATALAIGIQAFIFRRVPLEALRAHHDVAGALIVVVGTMYGILVATILVAVWDRYDEAQNDEVHEANSAASLYRAVQYLPTPTAERLRELSIRYLDSVIHEEWPLLRKGQAGPQTSAIADDIWRTTVDWQPVSPGETNLHAAALRSVTELADLRRHRLARSRMARTRGTWTIMVVGAVFVIGFSYFFGLRYRLTKLLMTAALTLMIVLLLFTTYELGRPFAGIAAIRPDDCELVLRMLSPESSGQRPGAYE